MFMNFKATLFLWESVLITKNNQSNEKDSINMELLIAKAKKNDRSSQEQLYEMFSPNLFRYLVFLTNSEELSEDILQDVFIKAFLKLEHLKNERAFKAWLEQMAHNRYMDILRSSDFKKRGEFDQDQIDQIPENEKHCEDKMDLRTLLAKLEVHERQALLLVDIEGYSYEEAAQVVNIKEDALRSRLHRARKSLIHLKK